MHVSLKNKDTFHRSVRRYSVPSCH